MALSKVRSRTPARPPGPGSRSLYLGLLARRDPLSLITHIGAAHPRLAHIRLGREHIYLLNHPELVHEVFARRGRDVRKGRALEKIKILLGEGLLTSEGELHKRQRRLIQPAFHDRRIRGYAGAMAEAAYEVDEHWRTSGRTPVDMFTEMAGLTLAAVGRALFGADLRTEATDIADCLQDLLGGFQRNLLPGADLLLSLPTPGNARLFRAVERLDGLVRAMIDERRSAPPGPDLLSALLHAEEPMSDTQVRDEVMTLLLAGHETTASALTWAWWLLDAHPAREDWLHAELDQLPGDPGYDDLDRLPRTHAVVAEAMRLYPPSWLIGRRTLVPLELDGWTVPAGSLCAASQWVLHRDPRFWSDAPAFDPKRWLDPAGGFDLAAPGVPRGAYLPFGLGSRACAGQSFAWAEGALVLAILARRWAPRLAPDHVVRPHASVTLRPKDGMPMELVIRARTAPS